MRSRCRHERLASEMRRSGTDSNVPAGHLVLPLGLARPVRPERVEGANGTPCPLGLRSPRAAAPHSRGPLARTARTRATWR